LEYSLSRTSQAPSRIGIKIIFDRGFLSETPQQRTSKAKFIDYESGTAKTGLGSSACVVVVVVGGIVKLLTEKWTENDINVLSQVANIAAQNKIGSNFDISTAVFGSQLYTNVLPKIAFEAVEKGELSSLFEVDPQVKRLSVNKILYK
jgi:phosphomevalonate kinase